MGAYITTFERDINAIERSKQRFFELLGGVPLRSISKQLDEDLRDALDEIIDRHVCRKLEIPEN